MSDNKTRNNKTYFIIGVVFVVVGLGGLLMPFIPFGFSEDLIVIQQLADAAPPVSLVSPASASASFTPTPVPFDPERKNIKNRLYIPNLKINMPVFESKNAGVLAKGGWIFPATSTPDRGGNTVIFGHRFRYLPPISNTFFHLDKIKTGDEVMMLWKGIAYRYKIREIKIIEPTDWSVLAPSDKPMLTLITCAPLFSTKQRLVVVAEMI